MKRKAAEKGMNLIIGMVVAVVLLLTIGGVGKTFANLAINMFSSDKDDSTTPGDLEEDLKLSSIEYPVIDVPAVSLKGIKNYEEVISQAAKENNLDSNLIKAVIIQESGGEPEKLGASGEVGLMQLMPETARTLGLNVPEYPDTTITVTIRGETKELKVDECNSVTKRCDREKDERFNPVKNIMTGSKYLGDAYKEFGNVQMALAAYNGGPSRIRTNCVEKSLEFDQCKSQLNAWAVQYVGEVIGKYSSIKEA
jgi:hypothetical protein